MSKTLLLIGILALLIVGCNREVSTSIPPYTSQQQPAIGSGCSVSEPKSNEGNFTIVYIPLRVAL